MGHRYKLALCVGVFSVGALCSVPAAADWIALSDGKIIETRGRWVVKDQRVDFTSKERQFLSIELTEVDLSRSRKLSASGSKRLRVETIRRPSVSQSPFLEHFETATASQATAIEGGKPAATGEKAPADAASDSSGAGQD